MGDATSMTVPKCNSDRMSRLMSAHAVATFESICSLIFLLRTTSGWHGRDRHVTKLLFASSRLGVFAIKRQRERELQEQTTAVPQESPSHFFGAASFSAKYRNTPMPSCRPAFCRAVLLAVTSPRSTAREVA